MAIIRKLKEKVKKIAQKKKSVAKKKTVVKKKPSPTIELKKEIFGAQEIKVEQTKYSHPEPTRVSRFMPQELPAGYGKDKIVLQVRDPWWLHAFWEVSGSTVDKLRQELKEEFSKSKWILRAYDVSKINFNGNNAHRYFDVYIAEGATSWYIDTAAPGRSWCVDLGLLLPGGKFITVLRSNIVITPLDGPSEETDEEWMIPEELFARLYGMGFGLGRSSPIGKAWQERVKQSLWSSGITSGASFVKKQQKQRKFWFKVDCELIVYGATEPDAKVTVQDKEIKLRPDGTFTLRFALPDGEQVIPVKAVSADCIEERVITPVVNRKTKTSALVKG
ncbi:MAG: DUF4912 domain-containing protein [Candidatus Omnitrophica bacterium]|nr:DUF4912 domain-containing protein [Candidatus Omnitrophota bacterium]